MGHLGHLKEEYRDLVRRLEAGPVALPEPEDPRARQGWREILEILYTPEEAAIAARLPVRPATARGACEARSGSRRAAAAAARRDGRQGRGAGPRPPGDRPGALPALAAGGRLLRVLDDAPQRRDPQEADGRGLDAYAHGDDAFAREVFGGETVVGRALVHETALGDDALPEVLDWERATAVVERGAGVAVSLCYCRHKAEHLGTAATRRWRTACR